MKQRIGKIFMLINILMITILLSGCFLNPLKPAPKRSFTSTDLLVNEDELPKGWTIPWGPQKDTDNDVPPGSMETNMFKGSNSSIPEITERVSIFPSVNDAQERFSQLSNFPSNTENQGWTFVSNKADKQKISCYIYSNLNYPICSWLARYQEITVEVIGRCKPEDLSREEMQIITETIDSKIIKFLYGS